MSKKIVQLNVTHNPEHHSIEEAVLYYDDINNGLVKSLIGLNISTSKFQKFIKLIINKYPSIKEFDYSKNKYTSNKKFIGDDISIYVDGNSAEFYVDVYTKTEEECHEIWKIYQGFVDDNRDVDIFFYTYFNTPAGLDESVKICAREELAFISKSYYPYIDTDTMFEQFFTGNENILLVVGEPGLGKSKLSSAALKFAMDNSNVLPYDKMLENPNLEVQFVTTAFVKSPEVLADDTFWRTLEKQSIDFCIIDDLDYMLTKRDAEVMSHDDAIKNAFLNQFLSFTDGVEKNNTKFIITTNQNFDEIDTALLRKGRLFDILELRKLTNEEALSIWKENNLKEKDFHNVFIEEYVLQADLGSEISKRLNKRTAKATQSYLKEKGISKVVNAKRSKKIKI